MDAYTSFAEVYDLFMDNVPYGEWAEYLCSILGEYHIGDGILLDLGCGTGKLTRMFAQKGYDMIGVDNSIEMLDIARNWQDAEQPPELTGRMQDAERTSELTGRMQDAERTSELAGRMLDARQQTDEENFMQPASSQILYLLQDMREFELYGTVRAVYSACDCLNYILEEEDLLTVFRLVNNYLDPHGIFIFDMNTAYKYEKLLADNTFAENREEGSFIWENYYDPESGINEYDLTLFVREEGVHPDRFLRFQETHYQRSYPVELVKQLLEKAGMEFVAVYDGYTKNPLRTDSERMTIIAREHGK
jgi:SAM-dependent methyltransferase